MCPPTVGHSCLLQLFLCLCSVHFRLYIGKRVFGNGLPHKITYFSIFSLFSFAFVFSFNGIGDVFIYDLPERQSLYRLDYYILLCPSRHHPQVHFLRVPPHQGHQRGVSPYCLTTHELCSCCGTSLHSASPPISQLCLVVILNCVGYQEMSVPNLPRRGILASL